MSLSFSSAFVIVTALLFLSLALWIAFIAAHAVIRSERRIVRRLASGGGVDLDERLTTGQSRRARKNLLTQLGSHLTLPDAEEITRLRFWLSQAGFYDPNVVKTFLAARTVSLFAPVTLVLLCWGPLFARMGGMNVVYLAVAVTIIGMMGPDFVVNFIKGRRVDQCRRGFPDMMDLLVACIEAGLAMDASLIRVSHEIGARYPVLKTNLEIMNLELRAGRERNEAMMNFAARIELEEARALAVMLKQAEEMGSSIGQALRTFSDDMRHRRMMVAEEKAMALSAKLTVPLILFIFPTILVMLLLPAGIRVAAGLS